jgi:hypothetical protein
MAAHTVARYKDMGIDIANRMPRLSDTKSHHLFSDRQAYRQAIGEPNDEPTAQQTLVITSMDGVFVASQDPTTDISLITHEIQHFVGHYRATLKPDGHNPEGVTYDFTPWLTHVAGMALEEGITELNTFDVISRTTHPGRSNYFSLAVQTGALIGHAARMNGDEPKDLLRKILHDNAFGTEDGVRELRETIGQSAMDLYTSQPIWANDRAIADNSE